MPKPRPLWERLNARIDRRGPDECWPWVGHIRHGYGMFHIAKTDNCGINPGDRQAHRVVYELLVGPIPEGLELDHVCHSIDLACLGGFGCLHRRCVNPMHMEPVTRLVNRRRGRATEGFRAHQAAKTHCPQGHPYAGKNLYVWRGQRHCVICKVETNRRWVAKTR